ncbi:hypothetical protein ACTFOB_25435 [Bacillus cereus group sp. MYBK79-1]|uniref:hypothetical protein n=1 Tax=unclassified Bacillus cereus group TaxID=2750818 RepID=UPI003F7929C8
MSITKEAIQYVVGLEKNVEVVEINGETYSNRNLHAVEEPTPRALTVRSLSSLVDYAKSNFDTDETIMIHVENPTEVSLFTALNGNRNRSKFVKAEALIPHFSFERFHDTENFNISMQSGFVKNDDRDIVLQVIGTIADETVREIGDDGVSQAVTAKTGVSTRGNVKVPNPVTLQPYRTFVEIEQPESEFIFRMKSGPTCALFEADGGAWKLQAIQNIKDYLVVALEEEIKSEKVFIIA